MPRFRIGIDLGTTNCALASIAVDDPGGRTETLGISQRHGERAEETAPTLPSFLYLPPGKSGEAGWLPGRWARDRAAETPGRVVHSAKSWLGHHAVDRRARFLPLGTADLSPDERLSPVGAQALLLWALADAWNRTHPDAPLATQDVAVTVPASFDPAAQQLTLEAAARAGFPASTVLLEEPQAAFYAWQENRASENSPAEFPGDFSHLAKGTTAHVLVADLGGGTTDFSLFSLEAGDETHPARLKRLAVSEHILLGGDNLDLALAHRVEQRIGPNQELSPTAFAQLLARCREIKEEALGLATGMADDVFAQRTWAFSVARAGASLLGGAIRGELTGKDIVHLLVDGYFPAVKRDERPLRNTGGLREMGLPYARDPAITRHLARFLDGQPRVDYLLCNGGLTKSPAVRYRLLENLARWQEGTAPILLANADPDLAVARGAARFLHVRANPDESRIEAGTAHSYYLGLADGKALCVLPRDSRADNPVTIEPPELRAQIGRSVLFPLFRHARRAHDVAGKAVVIDDEFEPLPPIEALLSPPVGATLPRDPSMRVRIRCALRSTGLLRIELLGAESKLPWTRTWPLEFSLRGTTLPRATGIRDPSSPQETAKLSPSPSNSLTSLGADAMLKRLKLGSRTKDKLTATAVFSAAEKAIGAARATWNAPMVRALFDTWISVGPSARKSPEQEESWFQVAGYLLRPGIGALGDDLRVAALLPALVLPPATHRPSVEIQRWICARRIASGLDAEQSRALWELASRDGPTKVASAEVLLLAGALERLPIATRTALAVNVRAGLHLQPNDGAGWKALGRLLARSLFHAGPEQVLPTECVVEAWEDLRALVPSDSVRPDAIQTWLRAARRTGLRALDVPSSCRSQIDDHLRRWDVNEMRRRPLHEVIPVAGTDLTSLLGEGLPPGLSLIETR